MHIPVLVQEMLQALSPHAEGIYLDGTLGGGGYAEAILNHSQPGGKVIGLDLDLEAVERSGSRLEVFGDRFMAVHGGFQDAPGILNSLGIQAVDGAVLDLGLSSYQLDDPERGFSFRFDAPLDMRFDREDGETVLGLLGRISVKRLEDIIAEYGEERRPKKLAKAIMEARDKRRLRTTADLAAVISDILGPHKGKIHPATRTFQALRIAANREMENLDKALDEIPKLLKSTGRFCVISYHSLEDRAVKNAFRALKQDKEKWKLITLKPIRPSDEEIRLNPRSRSAKMRVVEAV